MKLLNYEIEHLINENLKKSVEYERPSKITLGQVKLLHKTIIQKRITKDFFDYLISELYDINDWKKLSYKQMYQIIWILNHWDYERSNTL